MKLNQKNLLSIGKALSCPTYNRKELKTGIVHIGVGGFHRSHQAFYIHKLLEKRRSTDWAICGVGLREADRKMAKALQKQDCLYSLLTQHPSGEVETEIIGSITEYLLAADDPKAIVHKMAQADTKIVSLTITEGGYNFNPVTGDFDFDNPQIQEELTYPDKPQTIYGYLTAALRERRMQDLLPFTILSCDNIQHNGDVARNMLLSFAQKQDPELAKWIADKVAFPNSMVDRITPVTSPEIINYLNEAYGIEDQWPVVCEPFIQWVIENKFSNGRPALEDLGVQFVPDVTPYEKMKIRLLNAGHSVLGITGALHAHPTIDACMQDPVFVSFMRQFMDEEATPILGIIEGIDIEKYKDSLEERFANSNIKDSVSRICSESSAKLPKFLIPTLRENLETGGSIKYATFVLACWCYYSDKGINEAGDALEIIDEQKIALSQAAKGTEKNWTTFLNQREIFGDLIENDRFTKLYISMVQAIYREGHIRKLMEEICELTG